MNRKALSLTRSPESSVSYYCTPGQAFWSCLPTACPLPAHQGKSRFSREQVKPFLPQPDLASAPATPLTPAPPCVVEAATPTLCCPLKGHGHCMSLVWSHCSLCLDGSATNVFTHTPPSGLPQTSPPRSLPQALQEKALVLLATP